MERVCFFRLLRQKTVRTAANEGNGPSFRTPVGAGSASPAVHHPPNT